MKSKFQIDASQLSSEITQEVLKAIRPLLSGEERENSKNEYPRIRTAGSNERSSAIRPFEIVADSWRQKKGNSADHPGKQKLMVGRSKIRQVSEAGEVVRPLHLLAS